MCPEIKMRERVETSSNTGKDFCKSRIHKNENYDVNLREMLMNDTKEDERVNKKQN